MGDKDNEHAEACTQWRRHRRRYGPVRLVLPWIAIVVGAIMAVTRIDGLDKRGEDNTAVLFLAGLGLVVLGVIAFFVYRWMAKRGI
jgi:hypothetical protein